MPKTTIYDYLTTTWSIPPFFRQQLANRYILHWSPTYLFSEFGDTKPIVREGITYLRIYHACTPKELKACKVVLLSFRRALNMPTGYVLLTPARSLAATHLTPKDYATMIPSSVRNNTVEKS